MPAEHLEGRDLRLALPAVGAWLGAWLGLTEVAPWVAVLVVALLTCGAGAAALWGLRRRSALRSAQSLVLAVTLMCLAATGASAQLRIAARSAGPVAALAAAGAVVSAEAVVTGDPRRMAPRPDAPAWTEGERWLLPLRLELLQARGSTSAIRTPVLAAVAAPLSGSAVELLPSARVHVTGRLSVAKKGRGVFLALISVERLEPPSRIQIWAGSLREGLRNATDHLPEKERGLLPGLVLGDVSRLPPEVEADFRTAGLAHLTAVSGANCAIVVGFVLMVGRWLRLRRRWEPYVGLATLLAFVVLARPQPSVLRAAVMGGLALLALASGRQRTGAAALSAAVLGLLVVDPELARSHGFALSVLATGGILVFAPPLARRWSCRLPLPVAQALAVSFAASTACAPVLVLLSPSVSLVTVPANLLATPLVPIATVLGICATVTAPFAMPMARLLAELAALPTTALIAIADRAAAVPYATVPWPDGAGGALALAVAIAAAVVLLPALMRHRRLVAVLVASCLLALLAVPRLSGWPVQGWLLVACDVGQGDALVLATGLGEGVVVDAGPDPGAVDACLRRLDISRIPLVVLTHLHADHIDGLQGVLRHRSVGAVALGPADGESGREEAQVRSVAAGQSVPVRPLAVDEVYRVGALTLRVLWPRRILSEGSAANNASVVLLAEQAGVRTLLTGDIEPPAQRALRPALAGVTVDVLKVPHHGSRAQDAPVLSALRPRVSLISSGSGNTYGHPAPSTIELLTAAGSRVLRTDLAGDLAVLGPADELRTVSRRG